MCSTEFRNLLHLLQLTKKCWQAILKSIIIHNLVALQPLPLTFLEYMVWLMYIYCMLITNIQPLSCLKIPSFRRHTDHIVISETQFLCKKHVIYQKKMGKQFHQGVIFTIYRIPVRSPRALSDLKQMKSDIQP